MELLFFLISFFGCLLLVYRNAAEFWLLIFLSFNFVECVY